MIPISKIVVITEDAFTESGNTESVITVQHRLWVLSSYRFFINGVEFSGYINNQVSEIRVLNVFYTCGTSGIVLPRKFVGPLYSAINVISTCPCELLQSIGIRDGSCSNTIIIPSLVTG